MMSVAGKPDAAVQPHASKPANANALPEKPVQFTLWHLFVAITWLSVALGMALASGCAGISAWLALSSVFALYLGARRGHGGWILAGLAGLVVAAWMIALLAVTHPREVARKVSCTNNLRNIALALTQYHDAYGTFPPAYIADSDGKPLHSWRVLILPFLEQQLLYQQYRFDEPWDGPNNSKLHGTALKIYSCPAHPEKQPKTDTDYVVVVGPQTMWPGEKAIKMADIKDGTSNTLMVVEVHNSGIHWMEPRDLHVTQMPLAINPPRGQGISSAHQGGANVTFADGSVRFLKNDLSSESLRAALTRSSRDRWDLP
jgi:prepilin-type processing-associated H-X9-DG protein